MLVQLGDPISTAQEHFDNGAFLEELRDLIEVQSESTVESSKGFLRSYLKDKMLPIFEEMGFEVQIHENPISGAAPILLAERIEDPSLPTVLSYGHGDVVPGQNEAWQQSLSPWEMKVSDDKAYGRGIADNKGQHWVNICALRAIIKSQGALGFNCKFILEMMEERGSIGIAEFCEQHSDQLAADLFIASDGPRLDPEIPTIFLGNRGVYNFRIRVKLREKAFHSGNWGGVLKDPGIILAHAITSIMDRCGQICVPGWRPPMPSESVRTLINECPVVDQNSITEIDIDWGEKGLTPAERLLGWNSFAVLALDLGNPDQPMGAIAPEASAICQLRFVEGTDPDDILPSLSRFLDSEGISGIELESTRKTKSRATRLRHNHPAVAFARTAIERHTGKKPHVMPNLGGTLPNYVFSDLLGLPTIWLPHAYRGCNQHAPNEHLPVALLREALVMMTGLFCDLADHRKDSELFKRESSERTE